MPRASVRDTFQDNTYHSGNSNHSNQSHGSSSASPIPDFPKEEEPLELSGLYLFGTVTDRTRRTISTKENASTEIVTYTVIDNAGHKYYVDEYSPEKYNDVGKPVILPVYVKAFRRRNGEVGYSFCVQQQFQGTTRGEHF